MKRKSSHFSNHFYGQPIFNILVAHIVDNFSTCFLLSIGWVVKIGTFWTFSNIFVDQHKNWPKVRHKNDYKWYWVFPPEDRFQLLSSEINILNFNIKNVNCNINECTEGFHKKMKINSLKGTPIRDGLLEKGKNSIPQILNNKFWDNGYICWKVGL